MQNGFKCLSEILAAQIKIGPVLCNFLGEIKLGQTKQSETAAWKPENKKPRLEYFKANKSLKQRISEICVNQWQNLFSEWDKLIGDLLLIRATEDSGMSRKIQREPFVLRVNSKINSTQEAVSDSASFWCSSSSATSSKGKDEITSWLSVFSGTEKYVGYCNNTK